MALYFDFPAWISPEIIPGLPFQWYGMMYLVAFALSYGLMAYQIRERNLRVEPGTVTDFFFWGIVGMLVGARLFSALIFDESGFYLRNPHLIFWPFRDGQFVGIQGMNYYGGLLGATVGFILFARRKGIDALDWGDMLVAGIPLGYTFGRIGNFINGELFGRVTSVSWGVVFPAARSFSVEETWVQEIMTRIGMSAPESGMVNLPRHPTQLYEAVTEGVLGWIVTWFIVRKRRPYPGFIIAFYVLWYGAWRFFIDNFRMPLGSDYALRLAADPAIPPYRLLTPWNFIASQYWSFLMIVGGIGLMVWFKRRAAGLIAKAENLRDEQGARDRRKTRRQIKRQSS